MEDIQTVQQIVEELLGKLEIAGTVSVTTDETGAFRVGIETEETGLLIGHHG